MKKITVFICILCLACSDLSNDFNVTMVNRASSELTQKSVSAAASLPLHLVIVLGQSNAGHYTWSQNPVQCYGCPCWDDNAKIWRGITKAPWNISLEMGFLPYVAEALKNDVTYKYIYLQYSYPGTSLQQDWNVQTGYRFNQAILNIDSAIAYYNISKVSVVWFQGERDSNNLSWAQNYLSNEIALFDSLESRYNVARFINYQMPDILPRPYKDTVNAAKNTHALLNPKIRVLKKYGPGKYNSDSVHLSIKANSLQVKDSVKKYLMN